MKLAQDLKADYSHIHYVLKGAKSPSVALAKRIETATGGVIHWTEFFEDSSHHLESRDGDGPGLGVAV